MAYIPTRTHTRTHTRVHMYQFLHIPWVHINFRNLKPIVRIHYSLPPHFIFFQQWKKAFMYVCIYIMIFYIYLFAQSYNIQKVKNNKYYYVIIYHICLYLYLCLLNMPRSNDILILLSTSSTQILIFKYYSTVKVTEDPWKISWCFIGAGKVQYELGISPIKKWESAQKIMWIFQKEIGDDKSFH